MTHAAARRGLAVAIVAAAVACNASTRVSSTPSAPPTTPGQLYPTRSGGRTWTVPANPALEAPDWRSDVPVTVVAPGVFHTDGSTSAATLGEVRMNARSPEGAAWFRNVEVTAYWRRTGDIATPGQTPHWELTVRGERQTTSGTSPKNTVNGGIYAPPAGTVTWPWYDAFQATDQILYSARGASYHANVYLDGRVHFEKELTHTSGYGSYHRSADSDTLATGNPARYAAGFPNTLHHWFGQKLVCRNTTDGTQVKLELWLDYNADGNWQKVIEYTEKDSNPWPTIVDPLAAVAPYSYVDGLGAGETPTKVTWAGPWVVFRSDSMSTDFARLEVREIDPL